MAADTLTDAQARALRVLADSKHVVVGNRSSTEDGGDGTTIHHALPHLLDRRGLAQRVDLGDLVSRWSITPAGREALARHESEARDA